MKRKEFYKAVVTALTDVKCAGDCIRNMKPRELTKDDVKGYEDFLTVGELKRFLNEHNLPDNAQVLIQRVKDVYFEKHNWGVYLKEGYNSFLAKKWNADIKSGKYLDKKKYPLMKPENLVFYTEEELKEEMEQYHPAWACVRYDDDKDILFIDMHY